MEINTVAVVGLGALGTLYGHHLSKHLPFAQLRIIADPQRMARYQQDGVFSNSQPCHFQYVSPQEQSAPADLILVAVKSTQLSDALAAIAHQVGPDTLILSLLNGITSEGIIAARYGATKVIPCIAYGMDAVKESNRLTSRNMGKLCIGTENGGPPTQQVQRIARFFSSVGLPHEVDENMPKRLWGKFMLNVGVNQTVAVFGPNYGAIQRDGPQRDTMVAAMREVLTLSGPEKVSLTEADLAYWLHVLSTLNPDGKPSMRQDVEARRPSEVALFAGTVIDLAQKHGFAVPVNRMLFDRITEIEAGY
jgi:2-dehydropantoate 2-reductase